MTIYLVQATSEAGGVVTSRCADSLTEALNALGKLTITHAGCDCYSISMHRPYALANIHQPHVPQTPSYGSPELDTAMMQCASLASRFEHEVDSDTEVAA